MALKEFKLPDVGEGVAEGELVTWHVAPGDEVTEDQVLAEVETDKALVDVPSPFDGTVKELLAEEGEVVPVGDVIITIQEDGDDEEAAEAADAAGFSGFAGLSGLLTPSMLSTLSAIQITRSGRRAASAGTASRRVA